MKLEWVLAATALLAAVGALRMFRLWWRYHGAMRVECPETHHAAGVVLDARHVALSPPGKSAGLRLSTCSRWPERAGCGQECLSQIAASPEDCLVRNIMARWYAGKVCASCGTSFEKIDWTARKPALLSADKISVDWSHIRAESLDETLNSAQPICFACHLALTLVREHPDLAVTRPASWQAGTDRRRPDPESGKGGPRDESTDL